MPTSKVFLPDVNVWLALASRRHIHSKICSDWLDTMKSETIQFCRVTQMGLLRLLTTEAVMGGEALTSRQAWRTYQVISGDERVSFAAEPLALEPQWKRLTHAESARPKLWTDAYLSAFAQASGMRLVTLDRAILLFDPDALHLQ